jgi:hypothetical protein
MTVRVGTIDRPFCNIKRRIVALILQAEAAQGAAGVDSNHGYDGVFLESRKRPKDLRWLL